MIPVGLTPENVATLPEAVKKSAVSITRYFVENTRTARRFLKLMDPKVNIDAITFSEINNHTEPDYNLLVQWLTEGHDVGMMSEAGCPGIADPGSKLAAQAQESGFEVRPLTGPSSILLALMASGFNGQRFRFNGYLPVKEPARGHAIKELENTSRQLDQTEIFIETPYRNVQMLTDLKKHCSGNVLLCIACNITAPDEKILTKSIKNWKENDIALHKKPAIFLIKASL